MSEAQKSAATNLVDALMRGQISRRSFVGQMLVVGFSLPAIVAILEACSNAASPSSFGSPVGNNPSGKISLSVWGSKQDVDSLQASVNRYTGAFPKVSVDVVSGDCGADYGACKTLIAGGSMTDIVIPGNWDLQGMTKDGVLEDLTPYIARDGVDLNKFVPAALTGSRSQVDQKLYGLPLGYHIEVLYYNKSMFDKAGLSYPPADGSYTYDDVRQWGKKLTLDSNHNDATSPNFNPAKIVQWGFYTWPGVVPGYEPILLAYGGSLMSVPDGQKSNAENPSTVKAFQFIQDAIWKDRISLTPQTDQANAGKYRFAANQVAMLSGAHWMTAIMQDQAPNLKYDVAPLPKGPDGGQGSVVHVHSWSIYKGSPKKELAWHFIKFVATDGAGAEMGLIPAWTPIMDKAFLSAPNEPQHLKDAFVTPASWKRTMSPTEYNAKWGELSGQDGFQPALDNIYQNKKSAASALAGIDQKINSIMKA